MTEVEGEITKERYIKEMIKRGIKRKEAEQLWLIALQKQAEQESLPVMEEEPQLQYDVPQQRMSVFDSEKPDHIVAFQLELDNVLQRMEHILREDIPVYRHGEWTWESSPTPEKCSLNEYGVQEIMKILSAYVNRNTILSYYTKQEVYDIVYNFAVELTDLIYMKYEQMGMNTSEKRKNYTMIVTMVVDLVRNAYSRAIDGRELESLRKMVSVSQSTPLGSQMDYPTPQKKGSVFDMSSWFKKS